MATDQASLGQRCAARWARFWFQPSGPGTLGFCRALLCGTLLIVLWNQHPEAAARQPAEFWTPVTLFRLMRWRPLAEETLSCMQWGFLGLLGLGCLGLATRWVMPLTSLLGLYLLGLPNNFGKADHSATLPLLVLLVLAFSRCGDAWSLDALWRKRSGRPPALSGEYTWPIKLVWVLLTLVFFAAGVAKLRTAGWAWAGSDNMQHLLVRHHLSHAPPVDWGWRIARWPWLCQAVAAGSLLAELAVPLALVSRPARWLIVPALLLMQLGIWLLLGVPFRPYYPCYAFWAAWGRWGGGLARLVGRGGPP